MSKWIPISNPNENLPKGDLWVTKVDEWGDKYVDHVIFDMKHWSDPIDNVIAYMKFEYPEPYND